MEHPFLGGGVSAAIFRFFAQSSTNKFAVCKVCDEYAETYRKIWYYPEELSKFDGTQRGLSTDFSD